MRRLKVVTAVDLTDKMIIRRAEGGKLTNKECVVVNLVVNIYYKLIRMCFVDLLVKGSLHMLQKAILFCGINLE